MDIKNKFNINIIGDGPTTLVLAHGFGSNQSAWRYQTEAFKSHYRLILFDYLGCGKSDIHEYNPLEYSSLARYQDDVLAIYDTLNLTKTIFIGHSISAMIGALASLDQPERFEKLVFVGASPCYLNDGDYIGGFDQTVLDNLYSMMADDYLSWANGFSTLTMGNTERPELAREFAQSLMVMRPDIAQSTARMIFESDLRATIPLIQHSVLILQSQNDMAVPLSVGQFLATQLPHNRLVILNSQGHFPHLSAPFAVNNAIQSFILG